MMGSIVIRRIRMINLTPEQLAALKSLAKKVDPKSNDKSQLYMFYVR
jgi:hypothetical protein